MIQVEPIQAFNGFGNGKLLTTVSQTQVGNPGEYFYSQGMMRSLLGISTIGNVAKRADTTDLPTLGLVNFFTKGKIQGDPFLYVNAIDSSGNIYSSQEGVLNFNLLYRSQNVSGGNGLIVDQKNRLLALENRYIAMWDGSANYTTGTVAVTNGSANIVGTGTTFTAPMVGKRFRVAGDNTFYTVGTFTDATHIALSANYTGTTGSGKSYTVYSAWTDQWKDFGASYDLANFTGYLRDADIYEDWVVMANANAVALLNVTDDSFNNIGLNLPSGYEVRCIRAGTNGILIGLNFNNKGAVLLWDAFSTRSIAPWIWFNSNVKSIVRTETGWIVATSEGFYSTNGYSYAPLFNDLPDYDWNSNTLLNSLMPQGMDLVGNKILFAAGGGGINRQKSGVYALNTNSATFEFMPFHNGALINTTPGAIFNDYLNRIHVSYTTVNPAGNFIASVSNTNPSRAYLITKQGFLSQSLKIAEGASFNFGVNTKDTLTPTNTYTISLKIAHFHQPIWNKVATGAVSTQGDTLKINAPNFTYKAQLGDEVTILEGLNAGQTRHIKTINNQGLSTEQWVLDSALPNNTENNMNINISPFKLVKTFTFSNQTSLRDLYFDISNKIKAKHFLLKLLIENLPSTLQLELQDGIFIYDDRGYQKGD